MPGPHYFAWVDPGEEFDPEVHNRWDEQVLGIELEQSEGNVAVLTIALKNPKVGLLGVTRKQWCILSWDNGTDLVHLFTGRLLATPADLHKEAITLEFHARPEDMAEQKEEVAESLRVLPWWDELWVSEGDANPDTVLETRSMVWDVGRTDLQVTATDILDGEDGVITVGDHMYNSVSVSYGDTPLRRIDMTLNGSWHQVAEGDVDLTTKLWDQFRAAGSPFNWPQVGSFTSSGLLSDWPGPLDDLGGGWSMSASARAEGAPFAQGWKYVKTWTDQTDNTKDEMRRQGRTPLPSDAFFPYRNPFSPAVGMPTLFHAGWVNWTASFSVDPILQNFIVHYAADRERSETVTLSIEADVQSILVDAEGTDVEVAEFSTEFVDKPVDADGSLPIRDLRRTTFFATDRGNLALQNRMLWARAKLRFRSRAVEVTFRLAGWLTGSTMSCRQSILLIDPRLPGGQVTGKIKSYKLTSKKSMVTDVTIGCAIGYGAVLPAFPGGDDVYADDYANGYTEREGTQVEVLPGELLYDPIDASVVDDDGVDLLNMTPDTVLTSLTVANGSNDQQHAIDVEAAKRGVAPDPVDVLRNTATTVSVVLVPVEGGPFHTDFVVTVEKMVIPKQVDLGAPHV